MSSKTVYAYLHKETPEAYKHLRTWLLIDLAEIGGEGFNALPDNLPEKITGYLCSWCSAGEEGVSIELAQLTITSDDRGVSHWNMVSEMDNPITFFGDKKL